MIRDEKILMSNKRILDFLGIDTDREFIESVEVLITADEIPKVTITKLIPYEPATMTDNRKKYVSVSDQFELILIED